MNYKVGHCLGSFRLLSFRLLKTNLCHFAYFRHVFDTETLCFCVVTGTPPSFNKEPQDMVVFQRDAAVNRASLNLTCSYVLRVSYPYHHLVPQWSTPPSGATNNSECQWYPAHCKHHRGCGCYMSRDILPLHCLQHIWDYSHAVEQPISLMHVS